MTDIRITLPTLFTAPHLSAVLKYFEHSANRLSPQEWKLALGAFDLIGRVTIVTGRRRLSFRKFYEREVERRYADEFLNSLLTSDDPKADDEALQQKISLRSSLIWKKMVCTAKI